MAIGEESTRSDADLVLDVLRGERDCYAILIRRYERSTTAAALATLRNRHAAEDVAQDAFLKAYWELRSLRRPSQFGPWLLTIVRRLAIDRLRAGKRLVFVADVPETSSCDSPSDDAATVLEAIAKLPAHEQQVVLLRYFSDQSVAQIATSLGCPVGTVTKQISRALDRLRQHLEKTP